MTDPRTLLTAFLILPLLACAGHQRRDFSDEPADPPYDPFADEPADPLPDAVIELPAVEHEIRRGEYLGKIAAKHHVSWEQVLLANEDMLRERHAEICQEMAIRPRLARRRALLGCDRIYRKSYAGNLRVGWTLTIPQAEAPPLVNDAVGSVGKRVALVIEDSGSGDLARTIAQMYISSLRVHGKRLVGIFLVSDGKIRRYKSGDIFILRKHGSDDGPGALETAAGVSPDAIILIASGSHDKRRIESDDLPPVIAHCIPDHQADACQSGLASLAIATGGSYVPNLK